MMPEQTNNAAGNVAQIDGVRGTAALLVAIYHWTAFARLDNPIFVLWHAFLSQLSQLAVTTFFVVSGVLLTLSTLRLSAKLKASELIPRYFIARILRIAPLLVVVVTAAVLGISALRWAMGITGTWGSYTELSFNKWLQNILLLNTNLNPPGWTLIYEVAAYIILPFLVLSLVRTGKERFVWILVTIALSWFVSEYWLEPRKALFFRSMPMFLPGIAMAFAMSSLKKVSPAAFLALGTVILIALPSLGMKYYDYALVTSFGCACFVAAALGATGPARSLLTSRPMLLLGQMTYSVYLWHYLLFWCLYYLVGTFVGTPYWQYYVLVGAIGFPVLLALSWISYRYIELPGIALGRKLGSRLATAEAGWEQRRA